MDQGKLVPDDLVLALLEERLSLPDAVNGYLLDGFPRTVPQARVLAERLGAARKTMDCILSLEAPEQVLVNRLAGRYTCPSCNMSFNRIYRPAWVAGICDNCGAALGQRADDTENTVRQRLKEYISKTAPVLDFFRSEKWPVHTVESVGEVDEIYQRIRTAVGG
jgi:adenylate kinase